MVVEEDSRKMIQIIAGNLPRHSCNFGDNYERAVNIRAKVKVASEQLTIALFDGNTASSPGYNDYLNGYVYIFYGWGNTKHRLTRGAGSSNVWLCDMITASPAQLNNYYELEARWLDADKTDGDNLFGLVDGEIPTGLEARDGEYTSRTYLGFASWSNAEWRIDRLYVRKCASVEPAAEIGREFNKPAISSPMPTPLTTSFEYDDYNKLTEITFPDSATETLSYDDNGQLVKSDKSTGEVTGYECNDQGMLVKVILPNGEPVEYFYDGNQRLISRKSSDGVDNFVQSGWDIVTKIDDVGKRTYYTGSSAVESEDSVKYFHYNHRGDTVLVTDSEGNLLNNFSYEAYGKPTNNEGIPINTLSLSNATDPSDSSYSTTGTGNASGGSGNNLPNLFVGASGIRYDTKTNLHYMRFRWFSGEQMRFISPDLLMVLNRYTYVSGNPISFIDPLGLMEAAFIEYETANGKPVRFYFGEENLKSRWETKSDIFRTEYRYPRNIFNFQIGLWEKLRQGRGEMEAQAIPSPDYIYKKLADRRKDGLYDISRWPGYRGAGKADRESQNCRMFSIAAFIVGSMDVVQIKQFLDDNYDIVENPSPNEIKPGYIITYPNFEHSSIVYSKGRGNDIIVIERDANYPVYIGTIEASRRAWNNKNQTIWKPKNEKKRYNYGIKNNGKWEKGTFTPIEALDKYCKLDGKGSV